MKRFNIKPSLIGVALLLAILPMTLDNDFYFEIVIVAILNSMIAIGLNLLMGYAGQISLAHGAFAGLGGYISAILATSYSLSPLFSIFISLVVMGVFAYLLSRPILKLTGHYLAMATLGVGVIINIALNSEESLTGGSDGMSVGEFAIFGFSFDSPLKWYILVAVLLWLTIYFAFNLIDSPLGRVLRSLSDSKNAPVSVGIDVAKYKSLIFVLSVLVATLSGSLYAFFSGFISPQEASFTHSIELVVMVVLGGMGRVYGSLIGAVVLTILPQILTSFEEYQTLIYGVVIILVMIFMPKGVISIFDMLTSKLKRLYVRGN